MGKSEVWEYCSVKEILQNPRILEAGKILPDHQIQPVPDPHHSTECHSLDTSRDGDSYTSLGSPF